MFILGFNDEDVTGGWQHWRLATECGSALEAENLPASYGIWECAGEGPYLVEWYVQDDVAPILDRHGVGWRRFLIGEADLEPRGYPPLISSTPEEREILAARRHAARKIAR